MSNSSKLRKYVRIPDYLALKGIHVKYRKLFKCINPRHEDQHPSCSVYHNDYGDFIICYSCDFRGDIFKVIGVLENISDKKEQYKFLMNKYGHLI